jgi:glycerophosphoryl diester phosphodiesterase
MLSLLLAALLPCAVQPDPGLKLIVHRGGVVDKQHAENTLPSLQAAIRQGFWMTEIDVRQSKDGELVVQHDKDFRRVYGKKENVADLDWSEIRQLRARIGNTPPATLGEFAEACRGKILLMIDLQEPGISADACERMERLLREQDLLASAFFIGAPESKAYFKGKARIAIGTDGLRKAVAAGEAVSSLYFLFDHGNTLDEASVDYARSVKVPVVASVNTYHYLIKNTHSTAESDILRLRRMGVTYFQIDSDYAPFCR